MKEIKLAALLEAKLQNEDPEALKAFFGVNPTGAWQNKIAAGLDAAQRLIDEAIASAPALEDVVIEAPKEAKAEPPPPAPKNEGANLLPVMPEKKPGEATAAQVAQFVTMMRPRVRIAPDQEGDQLHVLRAIFDGNWSRRVMMLVPCGGPIPSRVVFGLLAQVRKQDWLGVHMEHDTLIQRARNLCAQAFLKSEAEWSWWHDADMICPFGDPGFFLADPSANGLGIPERLMPAERLRYMTLARLMSHKKSIVGGTYAQRRRHPKLVAQIDLSPRGQEDAEHARIAKEKGGLDKLVEVDYVATGCALVHRSVYADIMGRFPERAPKREGEPWNFFGHDIAECGEDIAFGHLAAAAGHPSFLDLGLTCVHVGNYAFVPGE